MSEQTLAEWINAEVQTRGWTKRELARRAGVSPPTISKVARGERLYIEQRTWEGLARALGMTVREVMARAGVTPDYGEVLPEVAEWSNELRAFNPALRRQTVAAVNQTLAIARLAQPGQAPDRAGSIPDPVAVAAGG